MKFYIISILFMLYNISAMDNDLINDFFLVPKPPSITTFAQACSFAYKKEITEKMLQQAGLQHYSLYIPTHLIKNTKGLGFRGIAFIDHTTKQGIIAYRGTEPKEIGNILQDIGIFFAEIQNKDPYEILHQQLNRWLWGYNKWWYMIHIVGDYVAKFGKYILYYKSGGLGWIIKKKISNHKVYVAFLLAKILGYTLQTTTKSYIKQAIQDAQIFFDDVKEKFPDYYFYIAGHSLGGFFAQIIGSQHNLQTYTFNAPGAYNVFKSLNPKIEFNSKLIVNYTRKNDIFGTFEKHIGITEQLPNFVDGISMKMYANTFWFKVVKKYWEQEEINEKRWFSIFRSHKNLYLKKTTIGSYYFDVPEYLLHETSFSKYILENHSITNLVNDLVLQRKNHFTS